MHVKHIFLLVLLIAVMGACKKSSSVAPVVVPYGGPYVPVEPLKTGQTNSYALRDDGYWEMGYPWGDDRFTDNGDLTTTDTATGLMWEQLPDVSAMNWADALALAVAMNSAVYCGYSDWRVPNLNELRSLAHYGEADLPAWLSSDAYLDVLGAPYATSTTLATDTAYVYCVDLYDGRTGVYLKTDALSYGVILVRGSSEILPKTGQKTSYAARDDGYLESGMYWPAERFAVNTDGTVTDNMTGLVWWRNPFNGLRTWVEALSYVDGSSIGTFEDWRLPNLNELMSLVNTGEANISVWLNAQGFSSVSAVNGYWTSTTCAPNTAYAWTVDFLDGTMTNTDKAADCYVWAVRGPD